MIRYLENLGNEKMMHYWNKIQEFKMKTMVFIAIFHGTPRYTRYRDVVLMKPNDFMEKYPKDGIQVIINLLKQEAPQVQYDLDAKECVTKLWELSTEHIHAKVLKTFICLVRIGVEFKKTETVKSEPFWTSILSRFDSSYSKMWNLIVYLEKMNLKKSKFNYIGIYEKITAILGYKHILSQLFFTFGYYYENYENLMGVDFTSGYCHARNENFMEVEEESYHDYMKNLLRYTLIEQIEYAMKFDLEDDFNLLERHLYADPSCYLPMEKWQDTSVQLE